MPKGRYKTYDWNLLYIAAQGDEERRRRELTQNNIAFLKKLGISDYKSFINGARLDFRRLDGYLRTFYYSKFADQEQTEKARKLVAEYKIEYYKSYNDYVRIGALGNDCFMKSQQKDTMLDIYAGPCIYHANNDHLSDDGNGADKISFGE